MKEVYVLTGRLYASNGVYDEGNNFFEEAPLVEAFDTYEKAKQALDNYLEQIYENLKEAYFLDTDFLGELTVEDMKNDYNMDKEEYDENEIQWYSSETFSGGYEFQMYAVNVPYGEVVPILPFLKISKVTIAG